MQAAPESPERGPAAATQPPIAVLAPIYPALTETFVYREVEGLRALGWPIHVVRLNPLGDRPRAHAEVRSADLTVQGPGLPGSLVRALLEVLRHPLRSLRTFGTAVADALHPGEPLSPGRRFAVLPQALLGLGVARWLRERGVALVHCQFANAVCGVAMYASLQLGRPFGFVGHANDLFDRRSLLARKLERARYVSCISEWHRDWYRELYAADGGRYRVVRCGVDVESFQPTGKGREPGAPLRVAAVARLIPKKGIDVLLRALAELEATEGAAWTLRLAGDGPERPALEALARELGCADRVRFEGAIANEAVRALLAESDVLCLPSRPCETTGDRDGIPVVLMEAMAMGVPVVAGDLPAIRELVEDGRSGRMVPSGDAAATAACLAEIARDESLRRALGRGGRERVEQEFSLAENLARLDATLRQVLEEEAPPVAARD